MHQYELPMNRRLLVLSMIFKGDTMCGTEYSEGTRRQLLGAENDLEGYSHGTGAGRVWAVGPTTYARAFPIMIMT